VFCLGDVADLDDSDQASRAAVTAAEGDVGTILSVLESIRCHVVYIPGNVRGLVVLLLVLIRCITRCVLFQHDPVTTFNLKAPPRLSSYSYNIHNKRFSLLPGLCVVGFGGSTTAHRGDDVVWNGEAGLRVFYAGGPVSCLTGGLCSGFPYTEEQVKTGVSHLLRQPSSSLESSGGDSLETGMGDSDDTGKVEETDRPAEQVILLTHLGPRSSGASSYSLGKLHDGEAHMNEMFQARQWIQVISAKLQFVLDRRRWMRL